MASFAAVVLVYELRQNTTRRTGLISAQDKATGAA